MKVRLYSHVGQVTGYGRAGVELAQCLLRAGVELQISAGTSVGQRTAPVPDEVAGCIRAERDLDPRPDVVIIHTLPASCITMLERRTAEFMAAEYLPRFVAYTTWETCEAPEVIGMGLCAFDRVWVPSESTATALMASWPPLFEKLRIVPHAFDERTLLDRQHIERDDGIYRFYYVGVWSQRKNPHGVIRAFAHAFTRQDPVELVLQCAGAPADEVILAVGSTGFGTEILPSIKPNVAAITDAQIIELHQKCDCFVTASRGEAWNLPAFDAWLAGNQVIAPMYSGSDAFLAGRSNAFLYPSRMAPATVDARRVPQSDGTAVLEIKSPEGVNGRSVWNDPDICALASAMKRFAAERPKLVRADPCQFGYAAVAITIDTYLKEITAS